MRQLHEATNEDASHSITSNWHKLTKFYFIVSSYAIGISVLAVYSTMLVSHYNLEKDDSQLNSTKYLLFAADWWNDYQAHKLREKIYNMQIDNLNISLHEDQKQQHLFDTYQQGEDIYKKQILTKYQFLDKDLHDNEKNTDSVGNLYEKARANLTNYEKSQNDISKNSALIMQCDFVTILLIVAASMAGISEIAKNKLLGYSAFGLGGIGCILLILTVTTGWIFLEF